MLCGNLLEYAIHAGASPIVKVASKCGYFYYYYSYTIAALQEKPARGLFAATHINVMYKRSLTHA